MVRALDSVDGFTPSPLSTALGESYVGPPVDHVEPITIHHPGPDSTPSNLTSRAHVRKVATLRCGSVGSVGDSYDALAETINGLYKAEVIRRQGPWRNIDTVEYATLVWVDCFNNRRRLEPIGYVPPAEHEAAYYRGQESQAMVACLKKSGLRTSRGGSVGVLPLGRVPLQNPEACTR